MRNRMLVVAIAAGAFLAESPAYAVDFYSTGNDGSTLYTIDSETGASAAIGNFGYDGTYALAFSPDNTLYALVDDDIWDNASLATVNVATGAATPVGGSTGIGNFMAMVFAPDGTLYAASWQTNNLYTLDLQTGAATLIGALGFGGIMDLAFDESGRLYGVSDGLYTIDTATGQGTQVLPLAGSGCLMALTIYSGDFYATDYCSSSTQLYTLDLTTGAVSGIGDTGISRAMALTYLGVSSAVPEPATWAMMLLGFGAIGFAMRRGKIVRSSQFA